MSYNARTGRIIASWFEKRELSSIWIKALWAVYHQACTGNEHLLVEGNLLADIRQNGARIWWRGAMASQPHIRDRGVTTRKRKDPAAMSEDAIVAGSNEHWRLELDSCSTNAQ